MFWFVVAQVFGFVLDLVALRGHSDREKDLEILLLRQQLRIVERKQVQRRGLSRWEKLSLAVLLAWFNAVSRRQRRAASRSDALVSAGNGLEMASRTGAAEMDLRACTQTAWQCAPLGGVGNADCSIGLRQCTVWL